MPRFVRAVCALLLGVCASVALAGGAREAREGVATKLGDPGYIILATTTSTYDSGLLDEVVPVFEDAAGLQVRVVAVGTGKALRMGQEGNADVLLVHDPGSEERFMQAGFGSERWPVMYNDFVLVGPPANPAAVPVGADALAALGAVADGGGVFVSRGDDSGTHSLERRLWQELRRGVPPDSYLESGQGMAATLRIASERRGYTLADRSTFVALRASLDLEILVEGDPLLLNRYHVVTVNARRHERVNADGARRFATFLTAPLGQRLIASFGIERYGEPLFFPGAAAPVAAAPVGG